MSSLLETFPVKQQRYRYDCSICSIWCVLRYLGYNFSYWDIYKLLGPDIKDGVDGEEIEKLFKKLKVNFIAEKSTIHKLQKYSNKNFPTIVSIQHRKEYKKEWKDTRKYGHYAIVLKVTKNKILLMDPKYGKIKSLTIENFKERWHDSDGEIFYKNCAITCMPKTIKYKNGIKIK